MYNSVLCHNPWKSENAEKCRWEPFGTAQTIYTNSSFIRRLRPVAVADPRGQSEHGPSNTAMVPIQSDSLTINFEFDTRPREVLNWFSGKLVKMVPPDVRFKAKMNQIRFPLGLRPRPRWGSLQCFPRPIAIFKGPTSKRREGEKEGRGGKGKGGLPSPNWGVWIRQCLRHLVLSPCYALPLELLVFTRDSIYAIARLCESDVSVRLSVCHTPVLCLAERKQDREMYTVW